MNALHAWFAAHGLTRPREGRVIGGVCAGIARRLGVDPWAVRVTTVVLVVVLPGSQLFVYPLLWLLMPDAAEAWNREQVTVTGATPPATLTDAKARWAAYPGTPEHGQPSRSAPQDRVG